MSKKSSEMKCESFKFQHPRPKKSQKRKINTDMLCENTHTETGKLTVKIT